MIQIWIDNTFVCIKQDIKTAKEFVNDKEYTRVEFIEVKE